jgi:hypothetical protein
MMDNIKIDLNIIGCEDVEWIHLMDNWTKSRVILGKGYAGQIQTNNKFAWLLSVLIM